MRPLSVPQHSRRRAPCTRTARSTRALFDALEERSPGRRRDIREVARFYGVGAGPSVPAPRVCAFPVGQVPPELAEFARQLLTDLDALQVPDDADRVVDSDHWPWTAAAAVLGSFQPTALRPLPGSHPRNSALLALADFIFTSFDGSWVLRQEFRVPCLKRLWEQGELGRALSLNQRYPRPSP